MIGQQEFFDQLFELTIRHIRYGVRSEYLSPFGHAMILTLEEVCCFDYVKFSPYDGLVLVQILQDSWTAKIEQLWKEVTSRKHSCSAIQRLSGVEKSSKQHDKGAEHGRKRHHSCPGGGKRSCLASSSQLCTQECKSRLAVSGRQVEYEIKALM